MTSLADVPFSARLGVLVALMIVGAAVEVAVRGREATRPREYAFLLAAGAIGAVFAMCVDQVTSRLSPEYFVVGKGLDEGPTFARAVIELSLQAGLVAGLVLGGVLLLANQARPGRPALPLPALLARAAFPLGAALVVAPIGALVGGVLLPGGTRAELARLLEAEPLERFMRVWGVHLGLYVGAVMGVIGAVVDVRRRRRTIVAVACLLVAVGLDGCAAQGAAVDDLRGRAEAGDVGAMRALAHKHLGCSSWGPSAVDRAPRRRLAAHLHLGLHADRRGDRAAARLAYSECVADCTSDGSLDSSPEHVWAEARLRSLE